MKCKNCESFIPPDWQACLASNICPKCGSEIMSNDTKELSVSLRNILLKIKEAGPDITELLLETYGLCVKSVQPAKAAQIDNNQPLPAGIKIPENPVHKFLKNSTASHLVNREDNLQTVLKRVNAAAESDDIDHEEDGEDYSEFYPEINTPVAQPVKAVSSPAEIQQQLINNNDIHPALQADRLKRLESSRNVLTGNRGSFSRRS